MPTAISFDNISKQYRLGLVSTRTLSHDLNRWFQTNVRGKEDPYLKIGEVNDRATRGTSDYVWALRDINFEVQQGDVLGIIGKNGAGKSTLLKILSKVTAPTTGSIKARGRIASLLEVGTGFHPEMTGRENIYMNGAIMGMTKREITRKLDEIVDFSGVERYLDTPAKRYSSGMTVRLGFAIAAHLDPEILVVDEVLAVGDAEFQNKAIGKMQDVSRGEGRTVLFVSHNMASMQQLCKRGIMLTNGSIGYTGDINDTIDFYLKANEERLEQRRSFITEEGQLASIKYVKFENELNESIDTVISGDTLKIIVGIVSKADNINVNIGVYNKFREKIIHIGNEYVSKRQIRATTNSEVSFLIPRFPLPEGHYFFNIALTKSGVVFDRIIDVLKINVINGDFYNTGKIPSETKFFLNYDFSNE